MIKIHHRADAPVASEIAFNYDADHRNVPAWTFGVTAFDPATELSHGLDAAFNTAMQVSPKAVRSVVQIIEPIVGQPIRHTEATLRQQIETRPGRPGLRRTS